MGRSRRSALLAFLGTALLRAQVPGAEEQYPAPDRRLPPLPNPNEEPKLPNGKSQKDAIAKQQHEEAIKEANNLIALAKELKDELEKAGNYVVPVSSVKKTEQIEKLARRIRSRLKQ
jgi:hypothetical protein